MTIGDKYMIPMRELEKTRKITLNTWRQIPKKQLEESGLPTFNQGEYRPYASIIYYLCQIMGIKYLEDVNDKQLTMSVENFSEDIDLQSEKDILKYTLSLFLDYKNDCFSNEFKGTQLECGTCEGVCTYVPQDNRYYCQSCGASAEASPNRMPRAIPVNRKMRQERERLHLRLNRLSVYEGVNLSDGESPVKEQIDSTKMHHLYAHIACRLGVSTEVCHIGNVCKPEQVCLWDRELDKLENDQFVYIPPQNQGWGVPKWS